MALIELLPKKEIDSINPESASVATNFLTNTIQQLTSILFSSTSPAPGHESEIDSKLKHITLDEVSDHYCANDCWIIIYDRVYDVTKFLDHVSLFLIREIRACERLSGLRESQIRD